MKPSEHERHASALLSRVAELIPWMQRRAHQLDCEAAFPTEELTALRGAGGLSMAIPLEEDDRETHRCAEEFATLLMRIGEGNLAVGRIMEAHFNARHLIARFGSASQKCRCRRDVQNGHLFALWVTDAPENPLRMTRRRDGIQLSGGKAFCSAAGQATRALVTAIDASEVPRMLVVALGSGERVRPLESPLQGMRAAVTGAIDFSGCVVDAEACIGEPGDYLREPDFSTGAWRASAVAAGGLRSLIATMTTHLKAADRLNGPHHLERLGTAIIAYETSRLWVYQAARIVGGANTSPARAVAYVGLARTAVEAACLDAMRLAQRSLGLAAFRASHPAERICRDLATYLRQPAPDDVLTEAAACFSNALVADCP